MRDFAHCVTHELSNFVGSSGIDNGVRRSMRLCSLPVLLLIAALILIPASRAGFGQIGTTATVAGTVTDPSGAVVAGAAVTIKNTDTSIERSSVTLDSGNYVITELQPGKYSLSLSRSGFKPYEQQNIILSIGQRATINVQLQIGTEQQKITVTASDVPTIQTEDSSIGAVIESKTIVNTPLNGRLSIMGLMALAPGVQNSGAQDQMPVYGVTPSIGTGSRNSYGGVGYTLDGANNMMVSLERGSGEVPPLDGIAEFKFLTSDVPAQFNQPAQVIVVSKGGGNQYHGMLVEFNRVGALAARDHFNNTGSKPKYIRNEYGANFSGPIFIPGLYKGKDRSFFFFNWENYNLHQATTVSSTEPSLLMRQGIFSEWGSVNIVDPSTGVSYGNTIPTAKLNSVSLALQKVLFPTPTTSGIGTNAYEAVPYVSTAKRFAFRVDHKFSDKDSIRGTYLRAFYGPNPSVGNSSLQGGMSGIGEHLSNHIVGWTHIFSPTLLSDVTLSYFHIPIYRTPQNVNTDFSSIIPGLGTILIEGAPQLTIKNIVSVAEQGSKDLSQDEQLSATVTKILARHTVKAGFSFIYDSHWNDGATSPQRGSYTFNATYNNIGTGYADFLLGYPDSTAKTSPGDFISRNQMAQYGLFVQDDWKITPKLTINMGLRWDVQKFRPSLYGNDALYVPSLKKVVVFEDSYTSSTSVVPTNMTLVNNFPIVLASTQNMKASLWDYLTQDLNNVAPRLGFAYSVLPKTVVRGAFGIYFNLLPGSYVVNNAAGTVPYQAAYTYSQPAWTGNYATGAPAFSMSNPFSASSTFTANPSVAAQAKTVTPYTEQYNLAVERELSRGLSVRVGYVGQHNLKQNNYGGSGNTAPDINYPTTIAASAVQARRPVQPWSTISYYMDPIFHSTMNSLQVGAHKQYSSGLMLNAEYSWTRVLGTENFQSNYNTGDSYGNIGGLTPHVFVVSYSYPLPIGQGKTFLGSANNAVNKIVGGWQLSGITNVKSGQPFSATFSCSGTGCVSGRADRVMGVPLYPTKKTLTQWFNPAAFTAPTAGGTAAAGYAYGNSGYNMLWGPKYQVWDMNLQKTTTWADKVNLQLRMDAFNVFNHPNYSTPNSAISNTKTVGTVTSTISNLYRTVEFGAKLTF
ncbi:MAG: TonB-dependent receptor [Terracidiphilus sp.]|nr:TonB-dependent receptor [Terracidiphilus sp.]